MTEIQGRTSESYEDFFADDAQPRVWAMGQEPPGRDSHPDPEVTHMVVMPCGHRAALSRHHVEAEQDGTFTIRPNPPGDPTNSNSILCSCGWHGYVYSNTWRQL